MTTKIFKPHNVAFAIKIPQDISNTSKRAFFAEASCSAAATTSDGRLNGAASASGAERSIASQVEIFPSK